MKLLLNLLIAVVAFIVVGAICGMLGLSQTVSFALSLLIAIVVFLQNYAVRLGR